MTDRKRLCLLGSTGSVGQNTLDVVREHKEKFEVTALACGGQVQRLVEQMEQFQVRMVSVADLQRAEDLEQLAQAKSLPLDFVGIGPEGHAELVRRSQADVVMAAMSGTFGLQASLEAIRQKVSVLAIANKEILVMAGPFIKEALESSSTKLLPVDSEHSAIFQALQGSMEKSIRRIILTASGGPFRKTPLEDFPKIGVKQALRHPNWRMGDKITIDSATMMNKGLEYIEALQLFPIQREQLEIVIHPQSCIHSMVEYQDHSVLAQMGHSDMRIPISYALAYPERLALNQLEPLDFSKLSSLEFEAVDYQRFPCLSLAIEAEKSGLSACVILNAANEVAVAQFLERQISFLEIPQRIEAALEAFSGAPAHHLDEVVALDQEVKAWVNSGASAKLDDRAQSGQNG